MGSSQSSRKLTIVNEEDDVNVIRISDAVAKRLAQSAEAANEKPAAAAAVTREAVKAPAHEPTSAAVPARNAAAMQELSDAYYPNFTISALEMQQQKERELADQETYWQRRLQNLERTHEKINRAIDQEYKKALTIFDDCRVIKVQDAVKPCNVNRQKVLKCYQDNPKETLRCADLVEQFSNCVDQRRAQLMRCN
ncbi:hypothetical protein TSAR_011063 [Trichomalopsis sarcophagae]|uniref:CHCH domain-containing protein n=1 Tax=Trichomalopsis sarcophagae TaxID=543379 RepID=A0A232FFH9_9HYME|nr:hypothetical protein TSAR_011063 [Trichomalopsis sarcophagae]